MSRISDTKKEKIKNEILSYLFENSPRSYYTYEISEELARDDEFVLKLLLDLEKKKLVKRLKKSTKGHNLTKKKSWTITNEAYEAYKSLIQ